MPTKSTAALCAGTRMPGIVYSERLGRIEDTQLAAATERLGIGRLVSAAPATSGLFGQNLFLSTNEGEFVLRGAPHWYNGKRLDAWQFHKEKFFADLLHENTSAPVPWPLLYDDTDDIFGWPYLVMPRLPGESIDLESLRRLPRQDNLSIAKAMGENLAALQQLCAPAAGDVDESLEFAAFPDGYPAFLTGQIIACSDNARANGTFTDADRAFVDALIESALSRDTVETVAYTHGDYSLGNVLLAKRGGQWRVSGIFDFHTSCFGNALYDLCRQACLFARIDRELVQAYVHSWRSAANPPPVDPAIVRLCLCNERILLWDYFSNPMHPAEWTHQSTFRAFAESCEGTLLRALT